MSTTDHHTPPAGIRPKAYRRPPQWVRPEPAHAAPPSPRTELALAAPAPEPEYAPTARSEPAYGIVLVVVVLVANLLFAMALRHGSHPPASAPFTNTLTRPTAAPDITLFTTPFDRRTQAFDATDAISSFYKGDDE